MEKLTSLNLSFDRVLIQLIIPGAVAIFPYFALYFESHPNVLRVFLQDSLAFMVTFITVISLVAGLIIEDIGSRIEVLVIDPKLNAEEKDQELEETWKKYLQLSYANEPIGQRYIRSILLRMKFELSMAIGLISMTIGMFFYNQQFTVFFNPYLNTFILYILPVIGSIYLFTEAEGSARVLLRTRKLLVEKYFNIIQIR